MVLKSYYLIWAWQPLQLCDQKHSHNYFVDANIAQIQQKYFLMMTLIWALSRENLSLRFPGQVIPKPVCSATETS